MNTEQPPAELMYKDIIPEYSTMTNNQKKKIRKKYKLKLREENE